MSYPDQLLHAMVKDKWTRATFHPTRAPAVPYLIGSPADPALPRHLEAEVGPGPSEVTVAFSSAYAILQHLQRRQQHPYRR